jgi:putative PIN family toxin of toxin-antitoxin system
MLRVVIDANIFASAIHNPHGPPAQVLHAWLTDRFQLIISPAILTEIRRVLRYPRIRKASTWTEAEISELLDLLSAYAEIRVPGTLALQVCRDPTDDKYLVAAVEGEADYLITGDKDLLSLGRYQDIAILGPADFLKVLRRSR